MAAGSTRSILPDAGPEALSKATLREAIAHARHSEQCVKYLIDAETAVRRAHSELQKLREAARKDFHQGRVGAASKAELELGTALELLQHAEKLVLPRDPPTGAPSEPAL